jgi:hypothetical protein
MSQNVTLSTTISPAQALALEALVSGGSITKAATEAGVARETVSRWVHHDPVFLAQLQNVRAELAFLTRCALEALGMQAVGVLVDAVQNQCVKPWRLKAACAVLKLVGADRAETMPATTAEEVHVRFQEREAELRERQGKLKANQINHSRSIEVADDREAAIAAPVPTEAQLIEPERSREVVEEAAETTQHAASVAVASVAHEPVDDSLDGDGKVREDVIKRFRQSVSDRVSQPDRAAVRPTTIAPGPADPLVSPERRRSSSASGKDPTGPGFLQNGGTIERNLHKTSRAGLPVYGDHPRLAW